MVRRGGVMLVFGYITPRVLRLVPAKTSKFTSNGKSVGPLPELIHHRPLVVAVGEVLVFQLQSSQRPPAQAEPAAKPRTAKKQSAVVNLLIRVLLEIPFSCNALPAGNGQRRVILTLPERQCKPGSSLRPE